MNLMQKTPCAECNTECYTCLDHYRRCKTCWVQKDRAERKRIAREENARVEEIIRQDMMRFAQRTANEVIRSMRTA